MNIDNLEGDFFKGYVKFLATGIIRGKYSIVSNGAIIKVKNSTHVRLIEGQFEKFPESFEIIAPLGAVNCVSGQIPESNIVYLSAYDYISYRKRYQGF